MIGNRRSDILGLIIDHYIRTGEPMGSNTLCRLLPYSVSSATIRNEMATLTDLGFLRQRHTSGGRVPTNASYRYYVDNLVRATQLTPYEKQRIDEALSVNASDPERLLADASALLMQVTGSASFYSTVKDNLDCLQGVDLIPAGNGKTIIVMLTVGGKIKSSVLRLNCEVDEEFRQLFYYITREFFVGTALGDIDMSLIQSTAPVLRERMFDMIPVLTSLCALCREASQGALVINGTTNLLSQTELGTSVYSLLSVLAEKKKLEQLLTEFARGNREKALFIGEENPVYELRNTATAVAKFRYYDDQMATLGVISSLRMDYSVVLPRIDYITQSVSVLLKEGGIKYE